MLKPPGSAPRVVLSKIGLDGHDRGIRIVARGLRDARFHVIYAGIWQTPEAVVQAALDEDADWLGISLLSGAHMTLVPRVLELLRARGLDDVGVMIGGIIPNEDAARLTELGVKGIFGPGTTVPQIVEFLRSSAKPPEPNDLVQRFVQKDRRALSRLLTLAARGELPDALLQEIRAAVDNGASRTGRSIALTGSGGVGKSSLIGRLVEFLRSRGQTVAVLCCDPESPVTGGALLGDRVRISKPVEDLGLFIRSLSARAGRQAIAEHLDLMIEFLHGYGFDTVILETVGAGQGDTAVHGLAETLVVLLQPETGDELQWEKAGLLEVADAVVIHKADLPGADAMYSQVHELLNLPGSRAVPVLKVSAATRAGLEELWNTLQRVPPRPRCDPPGDL
jgi:LAO/AO transport system ATPase